MWSLSCRGAGVRCPARLIRPGLVPVGPRGYPAVLDALFPLRRLAEADRRLTILRYMTIRRLPRAALVALAGAALVVAGASAALAGTTAPVPSAVSDGRYG